QYKVGDSFVPFNTNKEIIKIHGSKSKTIDLLWADNRPVIPNNFFDINQIMPQNNVASIKSSALETFDKSYSSLFNMMTKMDLESAQAQFNDYVTPVYNMVLADKDNISLKVIGKIPKRNTNHFGEGRIPSQGWLKRNHWNGYYSYQENPGTINPKNGIVANTNNKTTDEKFPNHISHRWGDNFRIKRLSKLMNEREIHTRDSFIEAQLDTISDAARTILPLIAKELWYTNKLQEKSKSHTLASEALNLLANWNGEMNEHMPEPLIYTSWVSNFQKFIIRDELGPLSQKFKEVDPVFLERVLRNIDDASIWCDIIPSSKIETCNEIALQSLIASIEELSKIYGDSLENWQWGEAHIASHKHKIFGSIPVINWMSNIRQTTSGGDNTLMRAKTKNHGKNPFENVHAAGFRMIVDFSDLESSLFIISTGQSGHLLSNQYDNLANLWKRGEYIPMVLDPILARAGSLGSVLLKQK
ncbi:penicillin acylase family protein, partial [Amylibacter sp.]|nr:penicillin acylase family protein [Amylibacter sp.]